MNFWSTERLTNALQVVGNIIAPLPQDYQEEYDNQRRDNEDTEENDNYEWRMNKNDVEDQFKGENEDDIMRKDIRHYIGENNFDDSEERVVSPERQDTGDREETIRRMDSLNSDISVTDSNVHSHDAFDSESQHSENMSMTEVPIELTQHCLSIESLQEELRLSKTKITSAFAEISSLSDDLRDSLRKNKEYEQDLESQRETQKLLQSRIRDLSQSKEQLAIQLSEVLQTHNSQVAFEREEKATLQRAHELLKGENLRLTELVLTLQNESNRFADNILRNVFTRAHSLCNIIDVPNVAEEITEDSLCQMLKQAKDKILLITSQNLEYKKQNDELEVKLSRMTDQIRQLQSDLDLERTNWQQLEIQFQRDLDIEKQRSIEIHQNCQQTLRESDDKLLALQKQIYGDKTKLEAQEIEHFSHLKTAESTSENCCSESVVVEHERKAVDEFLQFLESHDPKLIDNIEAISLEEKFKNCRDRWTNLILLNEGLQRQIDELLNQQDQFNTKYKSALMTLDEITQERDSLKRTLESADSERKKTIAESKMKIEQLLTKIGEMKTLREENESLQHLKEESELLKSNYEKYALDNKREFSRLENENRQLREIVNQLRTARKTTQESADIALADRQSYLETIEHQKKELLTLREKLTDYNSLSEKNPQLLEEVEVLRDAIQQIKSDYEARLSSMTNLYQSTHRQLSERDRTIYDLECKLEANVSDLKVTQQELSSRIQELGNLHHVISSIEKESNHAIQRNDEMWKEKMKKIEVEFQGKIHDDSKLLQSQYNELKKEFIKLQQQLEDEKLLKRKFEIEMISEKKKLHTTLQHALSQLQNSQNDSIDRLLIKNLILRYFQQKRSLEVLSIIARVLQFSNEEKVTIGLEVPPGSIITSLFHSFASPIMGIVPHAAAAPTPVEGENLAEMWLNYLIHESEVDTPSSPAESPSSSPARSNKKSSSAMDQSMISPQHRSYTLPHTSPTHSPTNGTLLLSSMSTTTASRMPNSVNKPSNIRIPSTEENYDGGNNVLVNGVRQVAQSPVLYPHNNNI